MCLLSDLKPFWNVKRYSLTLGLLYDNASCKMKLISKIFKFDYISGFFLSNIFKFNVLICFKDWLKKFWKFNKYLIGNVVKFFIHLHRQYFFLYSYKK